MFHPFDRINFIKTPRKYDPKANGSAPLFRRRFIMIESFVGYWLLLIGTMGYAICAVSYYLYFKKHLQCET